LELRVRSALGSVGQAVRLATPGLTWPAEPAAATTAKVKSKHVNTQLMIGIHFQWPSSSDSEVGRLVSSVKFGAQWKRERTADGEDREEETQGEGGAASQGEADTQQACWQRSPQDGGRAHRPSQDGGTAQGRLSKRNARGLLPFGRIADPRSDRRRFCKTHCCVCAIDVGARKIRSGTRFSFELSEIDSANIRQWIRSSIPAKHKKCGLAATESPKSLQNQPQNPILYQQIIWFCSSSRCSNWFERKEREGLAMAKAAVKAKAKAKKRAAKKPAAKKRKTRR
jgi:hypothetical protein